MIRLNNIQKQYGGKTVLDIPTLDLETGRKYAIIGPNGAGKSTLIRILAGTLKPDGGSMHLPPDMGDSVAYMPQQPYAFGFSVLKNVMIAAAGSKQEKQRLSEEALTSVGMEGFMSAKGNRLSGGETQRMALARMLVQKRTLLVLDEPASATDIAGNNMVEHALLHYCKEHGCTMVFSTHSPAQAGRLADTVLVLYNGRVAECGEAWRVLHNPESEEASSFLKYWSIDGQGTDEGGHIC